MELQIQNKIKTGKRGNPAWQLGVTGNVGGRPKLFEEVKSKAQEVAVEALNTIISIMRDDTQMAGVRVACAKEVIKIAGCMPTDKTPNNAAGEQKQIQLSTEHLLEILNKRS